MNKPLGRILSYPILSHRKLSHRVFSLAFCLALATCFLAGSLSADSTAQLAQINGYLKRAEDNLKLVQGSVGAGGMAPSGSQARLARMRLDQALGDIQPVGDALAALPATDAGVAEAQQRYGAANSLAQSLDAILKGNSDSGAASTSTASSTATATASTATAPAAAASATAPEADPNATVKLAYQQEEVLKGASFNLREVEGSAGALMQLVSELKPVPDQLGIDYRKVQTGLNTIENARRKAGFTQDALNKLPPNGQGVAEVAQGLAAANAQVDAADAYLQPLGKELSALIDPANYSELNNDRARLTELAAMFYDPSLLQHDPVRAASVMTEGPAAEAEATRIAQTYARLMAQETPEGKSIEGAGNNFLQNYRAFQAAAEQEKQALPGKIRADLAQANDQATAAVENQTPAWFTGGIPQTMGYATDKLALLKVLDPANAPALQREFDSAQAGLQQRAASLADLIIQQNPLPPDRYTGADRDKTIAVAVDAWKYQQPKFTLLASRIPSETWARDTKVTYSSGSWTLVDRSRLQVQLIVADEKNDKLAIIRPVNIWMDHQKGDALIGTPLYSGDEELQPASYMLRDKIK